VFITAWSVALCCGLNNGFDTNVLLLFLSTLGYYALDHALDIFRFRKSGLQLYLIACLLLGLTAMLIFTGILVFHGFEKTWVAFTVRFWPTLLISGCYLLLRLSRAPLMLFVRPLLIALGVGFAIVFPSQMNEGMVAIMVCFCNVWAFAFLERKKDAELGNTNQLTNTVAVCCDYRCFFPAVFCYSGWIWTRFLYGFLHSDFKK
jgi:hypothetical protein